jgi:putative ABC transport system substrate-binding protein
MPKAAKTGRGSGAIKYQLPAASSTRVFADIGGLMSFGADGPAAVRHGAKFVQRILQGKGPKDIPVEQPTKYELVINFKNAKALGITVPQSVLARADEAIE